MSDPRAEGIMRELRIHVHAGSENRHEYSRSDSEQRALVVDRGIIQPHVHQQRPVTHMPPSPVPGQLESPTNASTVASLPALSSFTSASSASVNSRSPPSNSRSVLQVPTRAHKSPEQRARRASFSKKDQSVREGLPAVSAFHIADAPSSEPTVAAAPPPSSASSVSVVVEPVAAPISECKVDELIPVVLPAVPFHEKERLKPPPCLVMTSDRKVNIAFTNVGRTVSVLDERGKSVPKAILQGVTGEVIAGQMLAVMGPSGGGKSTFLEILSRRAGPVTYGTMLWNGRPMASSNLPNVGFVMQIDLFWEKQTVRQQLDFVAQLKLPSSTSQEMRCDSVNYVIRSLHLDEAEHTMLYLLSGGQRKRVSIAIELLNNPSLLILDEPTSGLDSTTSWSLICTLRELAQQGRTIVCSLHQPTARMWESFDQVLLLAAGNSVYCAPPQFVDGWFTSFGYPCPPRVAISEHVLDLLQLDYAVRDYLIKQHQIAFPRPTPELMEQPKRSAPVVPHVLIPSSNPDEDRKQQAQLQSNRVNAVSVRISSANSSQRLVAAANLNASAARATHKVKPSNSNQLRVHVHDRDGDDISVSRDFDNIEIAEVSRSRSRSAWPAGDPNGQSLVSLHPASGNANKTIPPLAIPAAPQTQVVSIGDFARSHRDRGEGEPGSDSDSEDHGAEFFEQSVKEPLAKPHPVASPVSGSKPSFPRPLSRTLSTKEVMEVCRQEMEMAREFDRMKSADEQRELIERKKYNATWLTQTRELYKRFHRTAAIETYTVSRIVECCVMMLVVSLCWWQIGTKESDLTDRTAFAFFSLTYWAFQALYAAITQFPLERLVLNKERVASTYTMSSYFIAKFFAETPHKLVLPTIYIIVTYYTTGVNVSDFSSFLGWLLIVWLSVLCGEGLGLMIGALVADIQKGLIGATVSILTLMMVGGFYVKKLPVFFTWAKYLSFIKYGFDAFLQLEFTSSRTFQCEGGVWSTKCIDYGYYYPTSVASTGGSAAAAGGGSFYSSSTAAGGPLPPGGGPFGPGGAGGPGFPPGGPGRSARNPHGDGGYGGGGYGGGGYGGHGGYGGPGGGGGGYGGDDFPFPLAHSATDFATTDYSSVTSYISYLTGSDIRDQLNITLPFVVNVIILCLFVFSFRMVAFVALKRLYTKVTYRG